MRVAALLLCAALPAAACPLPAPAMQSGAVQAAWQVQGAPITVGRHFALVVEVCPASALLVRVQAAMPEHRHGMNYRPTVQALGQGRWHVQGLMFHMPGLWELQLEVQADSRTEQLRAAVMLP